jgi:hypothetical protein
MRRYCEDDVARAELAVRGRSHVTTRQHRIDPALAADSICRELASSTR